MEQYAFALLHEAEEWDWPNTLRTRKPGGKHTAITPRLLACAINESTKLGGTILGQFWDKLGECHPRLEENVAKLNREAMTVPPETMSAILMNGFQREDVDFTPVLKMASEIFTHLCVAFMNPGGAKSGSGTTHSVGDIERMETDELLQVLDADEKFGIRRQVALKRLARRRDGPRCPITGYILSNYPGRPHAILSHVIPHSFQGKPDTLRLISMFAGSKVTEIITTELNGIGNVMNLQSDAHRDFDSLTFGIEAKTANRKTTYIFRRVRASPFPQEEEEEGGVEEGVEEGVVVDYPPTKEDGQQIRFGRGFDGEKLGGGPDPLLCNLHLAVARVVHMSGAADAINLLMEEADDSDFPHLYVGSEATYDILEAKLLLVS